MCGRLLEGQPWWARHRIGKDELGRWLKPFLERLGHKARRRMCPLYVTGLIGPGLGSGRRNYAAEVRLE
jgi:hypothetical protein